MAEIICLSDKNVEDKSKCIDIYEGLFFGISHVFVCVFINITLFHRDKWSGETLFLLAHTSLCLTEAF